MLDECESPGMEVSALLESLESPVMQSPPTTDAAASSFGSAENSCRWYILDRHSGLETEKEKNIEYGCKWSTIKIINKKSINLPYIE